MEPANDNRMWSDHGWTLRERFRLAKGMLAHFYPDGDAPEGMITAMVKAFGDVKHAGINWAYRVHGHAAEEYLDPTVDDVLSRCLPTLSAPSKPTS
jgi:hypothetical protein